MASGVHFYKKDENGNDSTERMMNSEEFPAVFSLFFESAKNNHEVFK